MRSISIKYNLLSLALGSINIDSSDSKLIQALAEIYALKIIPNLPRTWTHTSNKSERELIARGVMRNSSLL